MLTFHFLDRYLDCNYAGVFIVWDRMFGTFEEEKARVRYGLTKNLESYNPFVIAFHEYAAIARDVIAAKHFDEKVFILIKGPEYQAPSLSGHVAEDVSATVSSRKLTTQA